MSELAVPEQHMPAATAAAAMEQRQPVESPVADLVAWAQQSDAAYEIAQRLAATSFVPGSLKGKPQEIAAAILAGRELGLEPMATLKSIDVIQGTPTLRAHAMRGLVQGHGHDIVLVESTPERCVMRGRRKGSENWQTVTWTVQRAEKLGLLGKDQWKKQPQTMLIARATGELCRLIAADVLYAMPYASEELAEDRLPHRSDVSQAPRRVTAAEILGNPAPEPAAVDAWGTATVERVTDDADDGHAAAVAELEAAAPNATREQLEQLVQQYTGLPISETPAHVLRDIAARVRDGAGQD